MRALARAATILLAAALLAAAAGCGSDGGDGGDGATFTVVGTEMAFAAPERVRAGEHRVVFRNEGQVAHELAFRNPDEQFVARRSIAAGQEVVMEVTLTPGTWELGCFEPGHYEAGMHKVLVVDP